MSNPRARRAIERPMRPRPTIPMVLPCTPAPAKCIDCEPGKVPLRSAASASTTRRAAASRSAKCRSAVASGTMGGIVVTAILRAVAAARSTVAGTMDMLAMRRRRVASARAPASTASCMRCTNTSARRRRSISSNRGRMRLESPPTSTSASVRSRARADSGIGCEMKTRAFSLMSQPQQVSRRLAAQDDGAVLARELSHRYEGAPRIEAAHVESIIAADDDPVVAHQIDEVAQDEVAVNYRVVVETPQVCARLSPRVLAPLGTDFMDAIEAPDEVRERSAAVRQADLQAREPVEDTAHREPRRGHRRIEGIPEPVVQVIRADPLHADNVQRVDEHDRAERLALREERQEVGVVEILAVDVGADRHAFETEAHGPFQLRRGLGHVLQRHGC